MNPHIKIDAKVRRPSWPPHEHVEVISTDDDVFWGRSPSGIHVTWDADSSEWEPYNPGPAVVEVRNVYRTGMSGWQLSRQGADEANDHHQAANPLAGPRIAVVTVMSDEKIIVEYLNDETVIVNHPGRFIYDRWSAPLPPGRRATPERPDWIWHDVEHLLRAEHDVDDDTFKGSAKEIYNLFLHHGWQPPTRQP